MKKAKSDPGRKKSKKSVTFPPEVESAIIAMAKARNTNYTQMCMILLARILPEAKDALKDDETAKHARLGYNLGKNS